ncbi:MAG: IS200/IS605 family transposase [Candidatus Magasanikbacteria bacterium]|nr:IS200/IS605 family transposase [Candidatus Magasanikbacteria bacterium]
MANTYTNLFFHLVFSVKERRKLLSKDVRNRLYPYFGGIANGNDFKILSCGGVDDHVHILLSANPNISFSKIVQLIKGNSSKWIHDTFPDLKIFSWQEGYGAFSVSYSQIEVIKNYIANQEQHHRNMSFEDEYIALLKRNNIDFDHRFIF